MSEAPSILLLADPTVVERLADAMSSAEVAAQADPIEALETLSQRPYDTVLVALPQPDLPNLIRAIRRLQPDCRVFGLCTPVGEYEMRMSRTDPRTLMEDYFIIPPTGREWREILGPSRPAGPSPALSARQISELIEATGSTDELCEKVAALVEAICRCEVRWGRTDRRAGVQQLCRVESTPPRVLWAVEPAMLDDDQTRWLADLRSQLPSLSVAAGRTDTLTRLAMTDHLTGVHNRRYFLREAAKRLQIAAEKLVPATLMVYDIDNFKRYNDTYGHATGDEILREIARLMVQTTRRHDLVARIGGDEFAVLFCDFGPPRKPGSQPPRTAYELATRFRAAVLSHEFRALGPGAAGTLTISGGLATFPWNGNTIESLLLRADEALLTAKAKGKNNIYLIGEARQG
ncbi:MAG: diguanylate cyclase [Planctomycetes bacterium]|nr:diguanylate cyclase [Planctomycetota bacterium]